MKPIFLTVLLSCLIACKHESIQKDEFEYPELKDGFFTSIIFSRWSSKQVYVYQYFNNTETKSIVNTIYQSFAEDLDYKINDSIIKFIENRSNRIISKKIIDNNDLNVILISDTIKYSNYIVFSEPFSLDKRRSCFSISRKDSLTKNKTHFVLYMQKHDGREQFDVQFIYDWQKDLLLKKTVIK